MDGCEADAGESSEGHTDHTCGPRRKFADGAGEDVGVADRPVVTVGPFAGVAVPGQVEGHQRAAAQRKGDAVPGVGVLRPTVQEHQLGGPVTPDQGADPFAADIDVLPPYQRWTGPGQARFLCVLLEEPELVVFG